MKYFDWDKDKNELLKQERDVCFEEVLMAIEEGNILDIVENPNVVKYPYQQIFIIKINNYAYLVPFAEDKQKVFLKTIIPSRKATKKYIIKLKI
ncbi:MAG: toxin [Patescibacteria group bacterium]